MEPVIVANTKFSLDLLKQLCSERGQDNVLFSPLSISSALGLVLLGAKGETAKQMYKVLQFFDEKIIYHDLYEAINKGGKNRSLKLFNRLYGERAVNFCDVFLDQCEDWCFAGIRNVDFKTNPEGAREEINNWAIDNCKIMNLLDKGDVSVDSILALISVIHFENDWAQPFQPILTEKYGVLHVPMMSQTNTFPLGKIPDTDSRMLEIPYANPDLSMLILLPDQKDGLSKLLDSMTHEKILMWTQSNWMRPTTVDVVIPRLELTQKYDLEHSLEALGMTDVFSDKCDLSGIAPGKHKLSKAVHGCSMKMDLNGITIKGGTDAIVMCTAELIPKESFVANHPFLFFIRHNPTKSILFWGRIIPY